MADNGGEFFAGFVIGALAGAAAALILAPCSGEEMRKQLEERGAKVREQAEQIAVEARTQTLSAVEDLRAQTDQLSERGRIVLAENVRKAQKAVEDAQSMLEREAGDAIA